MRSIQPRKQEQGVTIVLLAVCLVALLAMAALAIDVVTLYVARTEAQHAADAGALAGARMLASSGYTSSSSSPLSQSDLCQSGPPNAAAAANVQAEAVAKQNLVAGQPANVKSISCAWGPQDTVSGNYMNPQITVIIQQTGLPTFFARIWGRTASSVTASATAEAYNPSGSPTLTPIQVAGVKPFLVPNCDPTNTNPGTANGTCTTTGPPTADFFVDPTSGRIENTGALSPIGKTVALTHLTAPKPLAHPGTTPPGLDYYRINVPINPPQPFCPSCATGDDYHDNIACSSTQQFTCGQTIGFGQSVTVLSAGGYGARTNAGTQCLIHASRAGLGEGQDVFAPTGGTSPVRIDGGDSNPNPGLRLQQNISRSDSVVTVPIYQGGTGGNLCPGGACTATGTIVGFLQLGITQNDPPPNGKIEAVILNVAGCSSSASGIPVSGGGVSAIPVRLVHQ